MTGYSMPGVFWRIYQKAMAKMCASSETESSEDAENMNGGFIVLKKILFVTIFPILLVGCATMKTGPPPPQEVVVKVQAAEPTDVRVQNGDNVHKSMQIPNQQGTLSPLSFIIKDEAFVKIFSALSVGDVTNLWNDICQIYEM
jgi:hypothetical protein